MGACGPGYRTASRSRSPTFGRRRGPGTHSGRRKRSEASICCCTADVARSLLQVYRTCGRTCLSTVRGDMSRLAMPPTPVLHGLWRQWGCGRAGGQTTPQPSTWMALCLFSAVRPMQSKGCWRTSTRWRSGAPRGCGCFIPRHAAQGLSARLVRSSATMDTSPQAFIAAALIAASEGVRAWRRRALLRSSHRRASSSRAVRTVGSSARAPASLVARPATWLHRARWACARRLRLRPRSATRGSRSRASRPPARRLH